MPDVALDLEIRAPADRVWAAVIDIESYPDTMDNVRWVRIVENETATARHTAWSIVLKGSILEWEEREHLDHDARIMRFEQMRGDLEVFEGAWVVEEVRPGVAHVTFNVTFEIGIPLLADMLNPVAQRSLRSNCTEMLKGVERQALAA